MEVYLFYAAQTRCGSALTVTPAEEGWGKLSLVLQLVKRRPSDINMTPDNSPD